MRKFKNLAKVLLLIFIVNFIPVNAYVWDSLFGIEHVGATESEDGERSVYVEFNESFSSDIKEVKLHTKVYNYEYDYYTGEDKSTVVDGPILNLNTKEGNQFIGVLKEEQITSFGSYEVDKIEITLKDGSKRVSYNKKYYDSLSGNDKENGELIYYHSIFNETIQLYVENGKLEFNIVKLGQAQNFSFNIKSSRANVAADKVYVTFKSTNEESDREQVVIAEKLEDGKYSAKLTLNNSLDTGNWRVSEIKVVDNYNREYKLDYYNWTSFKVVSANTDIEAPKLNSIELSPNVYDAKVQEPIEFTLDITDDFSGFSYGHIYMTNGDKDIGVYVSDYNLQDGKYVVDFGWFEENGIWKIERVSLTDKGRNTVEYLQELPAYRNDDITYVEMDFTDKFIEVINIEKEEIEERDVNIEILEVTNNKPEISNGNEIDVEVKLKSDISIGSISLYYTGENTYKSIEIYPSRTYEYDEDGNIIENEDGIYTFKGIANRDDFKYLVSDKYKLRGMHVSYFNGEYTSQYFGDDDYNWSGKETREYDFSELDLICENPNEDINPPEVLDISLDKQIITPGETVELTIKVEDDNAGIKDEYGSIIHPSLEYLSINGSMDLSYDDISYDEESDQFVAKITIPEYYSTGKYKLNYIGVRDFANNYKYYNWYSEKDKELLSKGTILVKTDLNEKLPPEISTEIKNDGQEFKAPYTPIVSSDHGTLEMLLDGKEYDGGPINKLGNHQLYIKAIGVDGSESTKLVSFKVIGEINNDTKPEEIVEQIISSPEEVVEIEVNSESREIDKSVFEAIKGTDKIVSFKQEDGTVWSFNGKDITDENLKEIEKIKISVSNEPEEENKEQIENIDSEARVIHFDYHGVLPGKATVKVKVADHYGLEGKELTFYYFNPETQKPEKVQGPLSIDNDGYVTVEIEHCSDYFLSLNDTLHLDDSEVPETPEEEEEPEVPETPENPEEPEVPETPDETETPEEEEEPEVPETPETPDETKTPKDEEEIEVPETPILPTILIEREMIELLVGEARNLNAKVTPETTELEYISRDKNVVAVNKEGHIIANNPGEAIIVVKAGEVVKEIKVVVREREKAIETPEETSENKPEETNEKQDPSKENKENLPKTGAVVSTSHIVVLALLVMCAGVALLNKKKVVK